LSSERRTLMRRSLLVIVLTAIGLVLMLSFKSHTPP
jgi:hypothetical protein